MSLKFVTKGPDSPAPNVGSRSYLLDPSGEKYQMFKLKNREFSFDVDVSTLPCGLNGALYFVEMDEDGGMSKFPNNKAGPKYGTGYCDAQVQNQSFANPRPPPLRIQVKWSGRWRRSPTLIGVCLQCPHDIKFINGEANIKNWTDSPNDPSSGTGFYGTCCAEMDVWESNSMAQAVTPHCCDDTVIGQTRCSGEQCGDGDQREFGACDKDGGDLNPYRCGVTNFYGSGSTFAVDTSQPFTVVTQWHTTDGTDSGDLSEIRRFYVQNGKQIPSPTFRIGGQSFDSVNDSFVNAQKTLFNDTNAFEKRGGMAQMGKAMDRGMVLVLSLWADYAVNMLWLDSSYPPTKPASAPGVARGPCATTSGDPATLIQNNPDATVKCPGYTAPPCSVSWLAD